MTLNQLLPAALLIIVAIIGVSVGAQVLGQIQQSQDPNSMEYNITGSGLEALGQFGDWFRKARHENMNFFSPRVSSLLLL